MIGYVTMGTNDLPRAARFYDEVLGSIGGVRYIESDRGISWSTRPGRETSLSIMRPENGEPASVGNGVMVALGVGDRNQVRALHEKALELGAENEGPVGPRGDAGFYAGYFRDPDGNKLAVFCIER